MEAVDSTVTLKCLFHWMLCNALANDHVIINLPLLCVAFESMYSIKMLDRNTHVHAST